MIDPALITLPRTCRRVMFCNAIFQSVCVQAPPQTPKPGASLHFVVELWQLVHHSHLPYQADISRRVSAFSKVIANGACDKMTYFLAGWVEQRLWGGIHPIIYCIISRAGTHTLCSCHPSAPPRRSCTTAPSPAPPLCRTRACSSAPRKRRRSWRRPARSG